MKPRLNNLLFIATAICFLHCAPESDYKKIVEKELSSGIRNDSLFFGLYFDMSSADFYKQCWDMNKQGVLRQGPGNTTVYFEPEGFPYDAGFEFFPILRENKIYAMPGHVRYLAWAPWNKHLWAENLIEQTKELFENWYGKGFFPVDNLGIGKAYAKVDGNRRIVLFYESDARVEFLITDLTKEDPILKIESE